MHRSAIIAAPMVLAALLLGLWIPASSPNGDNLTSTPILKTTTITIGGPVRPSSAETGGRGGEDSEARSSACTEVFPPGPIGYERPPRYMAPGDTVRVTLYVYGSWNCNFSGFFVVELYEEGNPEPVYMTNHSVKELPLHVEWRLPYKENTRYRLAVKAVQNGVVVDTLRSTIIVPPQEIKVDFRMDKKIYRVGETAYFTITNLGETPLTFGSPYEVYRWVNGTWVFCDELTPDIWTMELHILLSGGNFTQGISLKDAEPGLYKVVKKVSGEGTRMVLTLWDTFIVVEG